MPRDYNENNSLGKRYPLDFLGESGFNKGKEVLMSEMQLSFEQLRSDIFQGILNSLADNSHSYLHAAASYGQDPRLLILPNIGSCMQLNAFGSLILPFEIPNKPKLTLAVTMTLGRLSYTIQASNELAELCDLVQSVEHLSLEAGLKFQARTVTDGVRLELTNDPGILSAPVTINILRQAQLEVAFKEFVRLQVDRMIIGVSEILAQHGVRRPDAGGVYCLAIFKHLGYDSEVRMILQEEFDIVSVDTRDALNIVYSLKTKESTAAPLLLCETVQARLADKLYHVHLMPTWGFQALNESLVPKVIEKIVVETRTVEVQPPEMDWKALIREPILD